jgi:hypothetical protein
MEAAKVRVKKTGREAFNQLISMSPKRFACDATGRRLTGCKVVDQSRNSRIGDGQEEEEEDKRREVAKVEGDVVEVGMVRTVRTVVWTRHRLTNQLSPPQMRRLVASPLSRQPHQNISSVALHPFRMQKGSRGFTFWSCFPPFTPPTPRSIT